MKIKRNSAPTRLAILQAIFEEFQQYTQTHCLAQSKPSAYLQRAEALIELLEVVDCGSVGGFDDDNPVVNITNHRLYNRFLAVLKKYNKPSDIKKVCQFRPTNLGEYFKQLTALRETFNT